MNLRQIFGVGVQRVLEYFGEGGWRKINPSLCSKNERGP